MDWMEDMQRRYRLRRKVLFDRTVPCFSRFAPRWPLKAIGR